MENYFPYKIGRTVLKLKNGNALTLEKIRCIPVLNINLISLGILDDEVMIPSSIRKFCP